MEGVTACPFIFTWSGLTRGSNYTAPYAIGKSRWDYFSHDVTTTGLTGHHHQKPHLEPDFSRDVEKGGLFAKVFREQTIYSLLQQAFYKCLYRECLPWI